MNSLITFFLIVFIGLFSSTLLRKLHFPWVVALILGGVLMGPYGLKIITPDSTTEFIGQLGLTFLMFMAGLETKLSSFKTSGKKLFLLAFINGLIPFLLGYQIGYYLGYKPTTMFLIGTVFVSSSIAVVIPTLEVNDLLDMKIGKAVMTTSIIQDIASLLLMSFAFQKVNEISRLPLIIFYPVVFVAIVLLRYSLPKIRDLLSKMTSNEDLYQDELRLVFFILIGTVILFELLGLHSIIGAFFAGLVLSDSITNEVLIEKIHALSYGMFIPTFFVLVGLNTDLHSFEQAHNAGLVVLLITAGSIFSKFVSGAFGARIVGFNNIQSAFFGMSSVPQLSTTLAVAYTASELGIIDANLNTAFVMLSIISTIFGPVIMAMFDNEKLKIQ